MELICENHVFIAGNGNKVIGKENMIKAWESYFNFVPDYNIKIDEIAYNDSSIILIGSASETYHYGSDSTLHWHTLAEWKAVL